jgi:hypothetical protein
MTASLCHRGTSCGPRSASAAVREHALPQTGRDLDDRGSIRRCSGSFSLFRADHNVAQGVQDAIVPRRYPLLSAFTASRAASCVRLKRCSPKVACAEPAKPRTKSSTASREAPMIRSSVAGGNGRTQLQMQSTRLPSGTSVPEACQMGKYVRNAEPVKQRIKPQPDHAARWRGTPHAHPRNRCTHLHCILGRAVHARGSRLTLRNQRRLGRGLRIPWHFRLSGHNRR